MESMKEIAKQKANEERKRLESEVSLFRDSFGMIVHFPMIFLFEISYKL